MVFREGLPPHGLPDAAGGARDRAAGPLSPRGEREKGGLRCLFGGAAPAAGRRAGGEYRGRTFASSMCVSLKEGVLVRIWTYWRERIGIKGGDQRLYLRNVVAFSPPPIKM